MAFIFWKLKRTPLSAYWNCFGGLHSNAKYMVFSSFLTHLRSQFQSQRFIGHSVDCPPVAIIKCRLVAKGSEEGRPLEQGSWRGGGSVAGAERKWRRAGLRSVAYLLQSCQLIISLLANQIPALCSSESVSCRALGKINGKKFPNLYFSEIIQENKIYKVKISI